MATKLPISKVKKIIRFDPESGNASAEASFAVSYACELFLKTLSREVSTVARFNKRKTIQIKDVSDCIKSIARFEFLDGAIDTFSDPPKKSRRLSPVEPELAAGSGGEEGEADDGDDAADIDVDELAENNEGETTVVSEAIDESPVAAGVVSDLASVEPAS